MHTAIVKKYRPTRAIHLPDRSWPARVIEGPPIWCSVDLRDGNQALSRPMNPETKLRFFRLLVEIGFREIEIGFPSASRDEFIFTRRLIEEGHIPNDVTVQVLTPAREALIQKTFEALEGVNRAIVHLYNSTSRVQREVVFGMTRKEVRELAIRGAAAMHELRERTDGEIRFEYSPESFTATEPEFALDICHAVMDVWDPSPADPVILNLPATVEMFTPNVHADLIEWFCRRVRARNSVIISIHPHNDRGTATAAAELALMAGADRIEGTLFGNGERTGNLDIVTVALNMYSQGMDPGLDFSRMARVRDIYETCTGMQVHPRHPYAGDLVYTAFSGSHQDAINKGMRVWRERGGAWEVPYLPIDPCDVGRSYESVVRINSQSGKGGAAWVLEHHFGLVVPREMQPEVARAVQRVSEETGTEVAASRIGELFEQEFVGVGGRVAFRDCGVTTQAAEPAGAGGTENTRVEITLEVDGKEVRVAGFGNGPLNAFVNAVGRHLGIPLEIVTYAEHSLEKGSDSQAVAYVGIQAPGDTPCFGAGIDSNIGLAAMKAVVAAMNRRDRATETPCD